MGPRAPRLAGGDGVSEDRNLLEGFNLIPAKATVMDLEKIVAGIRHAARQIDPPYYHHSIDAKIAEAFGVLADSIEEALKP